MIELCTLGTGAMMPMPGRRLAAAMLRLNGRQLLIDAGEGTQVAVRDSGWSLARIDVICFTHYHADHIAGLPGLLLTMGTSGRTEKVAIVGPSGLARVVNSLRVIAPVLPYELELIELISDGHVLEFEGAALCCARLDHVIPCLGYSLELARPGKFDPERARALGVPVQDWKRLQRGEEVAGVRPEMVLGPARKGLKLAYSTDTRPCAGAVELARLADVFICEGTYADDDKLDKAREHGHMTFAQAARLAREAGASELILTHFSPSVSDPEEYIGAARREFLNSSCACDNMHRVMRFSE